MLAFLLALVFWLGLAMAAGSFGLIAFCLSCVAYDRWRDRDACKRAEQLASVARLTPEQRTLSEHLDRIWQLPPAPDRNLQAERTSTVAVLFDVERHGVRLP